MVTKKKPWEQLDLSSLVNCRVIGCDPSLAGTGLVFIEVHDGEVGVIDCKKLITKPTDKVGWEDTFKRADQLQDMMHDLLVSWTFDFGDTFLEAVHEAPPVGGEMVRTESSVLAGYAFERACKALRIDQGPLVVPTAHKYLLCGNGRAQKKEHHAKLKELLPDIFEGKYITNEALRDALSIALYHAHRKSQG